MEEDIKHIEYILYSYKNDEEFGGKYISGELFEKDFIAIEHLIKAYKELEEENQQLEAIKDEAIRRYNFESIPVSLIKEKIEELKQYKISLLQEDYVKKQKEFTNQNVLVCNAIRDIAATGKIEVLQELLEKRK